METNLCGILYKHYGTSSPKEIMDLFFKCDELSKNGYNITAHTYHDLFIGHDILKINIENSMITIALSYDRPYIQDDNAFIGTINKLYNDIAVDDALEQNIDNKWDVRFLELAQHISTWSLDPSTKVGAVVFNGKYPIATSYNGLPPGIADSENRLNDRELKYKLVQHAESNALSTCSKLGISTEGTAIAVTHFPCSTCAGQLISAGITKVITSQPDDKFYDRWKDSIELAKEMFNEAGVELIQI